MKTNPVDRGVDSDVALLYSLDYHKDPLSIRDTTCGCVYRSAVGQERPDSFVKGGSVYPTQARQGIQLARQRNLRIGQQTHKIMAWLSAPQQVVKRFFTLVPGGAARVETCSASEKQVSLFLSALQARPLRPGTPTQSHHQTQQQS